MWSLHRGALCHYKHGALISAAPSIVRSYLLGGRQTRTRLDLISTRFKTLAGAQDLFKYSDKRLQRATYPTKERLDEVEKILGYLPHDMCVHSGVRECQCLAYLEVGFASLVMLTSSASRTHSRVAAHP